MLRRLTGGASGAGGTARMNQSAASDPANVAASSA